MEPRGCWVEFATLGKNCLPFVFLFYFPPYMELWPPLSPAPICVTTQYWRPLSSQELLSPLTLRLRPEPSDYTSDCEAPFRTGSGSGSHRLVALAGTAKPCHRENRISGHGYCYPVPLLHVGAMSRSLVPPWAMMAGGEEVEKAACCSCLF